MHLKMQRLAPADGISCSRVGESSLSVNYPPGGLILKNVEYSVVQQGSSNLMSYVIMCLYV